MSRLVLTYVYAVDATSVYFRKVRGVVQHKGQQYCDENIHPLYIQYQWKKVVEEDDFDDYEDDEFDDDDDDDDDRYDSKRYDDEDDYADDDFEEEEFDEVREAPLRTVKFDDFNTITDMSLYEDENFESFVMDEEEEDDMVDDLDDLLSERPKERRSHSEKDDTFQVDYIDLD